MSYLNQVQNMFVMGTVLALLLVGFFISLQSGVRSLSSAQGAQRFLENFYRVLIRLFGYLAGLAIVQQFIGFPIHTVW
jgi:hypothetical protein